MDKVKLLNSGKDYLKHHAVVVLFVVLTLISAGVSGLQPHFIVNELVGRVSRNSFLVLSLIIPIIAGVGLNFGIVVGAMAGQIGLVLAVYWGWSGPLGLLITIVVSTPFAIFFGYLTGVLFNKTKGQEMISGLIVSFFANGLYQFLFLFLVGTLIPVKDTPMVMSGGVGLRNTIALGSKHGEGLKYALDYILRVNLWHIMIGVSVLAVAFIIIKALRSKKGISYIKLTPYTVLIIISIYVLTAPNLAFLARVKAPVITWIIIAGLCFFTKFIFKTKLGQDFRAIGQTQHIASVAGINVDRTRLIAVIMSTVFAAWGQIIFLQNMGTINTYGSHMQVGMFAIAAILIGGASVSKATISQAIIGTVLLHAIFVVSPSAGKEIFGDAQIGEFFRSAVVYGVIGVSLGLHAWKKIKK